MKLYQDYKTYSDHEMAEKREIVRQYERKYNGKLCISVDADSFVVTCNDYHIRVNTKLELLTLLEYKITLRRHQMAATKIQRFYRRRLRIVRFRKATVIINTESNYIYRVNSRSIGTTSAPT
jgi:hypothetical protein